MTDDHGCLNRTTLGREFGLVGGSRWPPALLSVALLGAAVLTADAIRASEAPSDGPRLQLIARYSLPADTAPADLRWAGKRSVYLADIFAGVHEVELADGLPVLRQVMPSAKSVGLATIVHMAASSEAVVMSSIGGPTAWDRLETDALSEPPKVRKKSGQIQDLDLRGDEVIVLGVPDVKAFESGGMGGVVWRSKLSSGLDSWELVYESPAVARARGTNLGHPESFGTLRFLPNGDFVVVARFLPGVLLFSSSGSLKKTWSPEEIWGGTSSPSGDGRIKPGGLRGFLAKQRLIDEVLALPQGPAIVVREPRSQGGARWRLGVLGAEVEWYDIPITGVDGAAKLRGDVDAQGRIALVGAWREIYEEAQLARSELVVLSLPQ
jgi:hypothetical protein